MLQVLGCVCQCSGVVWSVERSLLHNYSIRVSERVLHHLPVLFPQVDDPPEAVGPYLYRTHFTPQGTQTVLRSSSIDGGQQEQVVVSDDVIQRDMADAQRLTGLQLTGVGERGCSCVCPAATCD